MLDDLKIDPLDMKVRQVLKATAHILVQAIRNLFMGGLGELNDRKT